jgi:quinoprotein glucose dehydrogenase
MAIGSGGTNWPGGSYDPETHIAYIPSQRIFLSIGLIPGDPKVTDMAYVQGIAGSRSSAGGGEGAGPGFTVQGLPIVKPPYGTISAIDLNKGEILWQIANGETPDAIRNNPALKGLNIPRTGRPGVFGVLLTKTLLICGELNAGKSDVMLRAYDKATGKEVGAVPMPAGQTGTPMTYSMNGRQYIVVAISGAGFPGELIAYRLPEEERKN